MLVLALASVNTPKASATDSCLIATSHQEIVWNDPLHTDAYYVRVGSTCNIKLYDMDISFTDIDGVEGLIPLHSDNNDDLTNVRDISRELRMTWSGSEDEQEGVDYVEFSPEDSGDDLFGFWYIVPMASLNPPATFKRNLPITINSAHYEVDGEMKEVTNLVFDSVLTKTPDSEKDILMISGIEKQAVTYTDQPVSLEGELRVEENDDNITAEDLTEQYYVYDDSDLSFTPIERPTNPGEFYLVEYNFENDKYRASLRVPFTIKEYVNVRVDLQGGEGAISAPAYVDLGGDAHIELLPSEGFEVLWVKQNGVDVTDQLNEDNSLDIEGLTEDVEVVAAYRPFYLVTEGDGGEYVKGSKNNLDFVVDKNPASYTSGMVTIAVDGEYIDLRSDSEVEPEAKTFTLLGDYLETLSLGEHNLEIFFFDTDRNGIARARFTVVEATEETSSDDTSTEVSAPNTGRFTSGNNTSIPEGQATTVMLATILAIPIILSFVIVGKRFNKTK